MNPPTTDPSATDSRSPTARPWRRWGPEGDSYAGALAEALNSLYKAELIRNKGPWTSIDDVELATAEWVHWYNTVRPHSAIGMLTPVEHEHTHHTATGAEATALEVVDRPLPQTTTTR